MLYTIKNELLSVTVDTQGAQLMSILGADGTEYLWQGDPAYWGERAPVLFPVIGRLENKQYQLEGRVYDMLIHGFAKRTAFALQSRTETSLTLALGSTPETFAVFPFDFVLEITYALAGQTLSVSHRVCNRGDKTMHFALGGHPGFRVPLDQDGQFADYYLEFDRPAQPERIGFTADTVLVNGQTTPYPLENGIRLPLAHGLFDEDAIILKNMAPGVTLKRAAGGHAVTLSYPDMPYLGFWHMPNTDAPYVCIEPWTSLPGRSRILEDLAQREDFIHLPGNRTYENTFTVTVQ